LRIDFRIDPGLEAQALASLKYRRGEPSDRLAPLLLEAMPLALLGKYNFRLRGFIKISGKLLKFDPTDEDLGLFSGTAEKPKPVRSPTSK